MTKPKKAQARKPRTRANGTWTEAKMFGFIRSALRLASSKWPPIARFKERHRRPYFGPSRHRFECQCADCGGWFKMKEVAVDHIVAVGTLRDWDDIGGFCERLFVEEDALQLLCTSCHQTKTNRKF